MDAIQTMIHELEDPHQQSEDYTRHIEEYLAKIFNAFFTGEVDHPEKQPENKRSPLGMLLKELHELVVRGRARTNEAEAALQKIIDIRCLDKPEETKAKMTKDYDRFLEIKAERDERIRKSNEAAAHHLFGKGLKAIAHVQDESFWGTAQQLRSGKVVADFLGGLDPVFGVLLNVTGEKAFLLLSVPTPLIELVVITCSVRVTTVGHLTV